MVSYFFDKYFRVNLLLLKFTNIISSYPRPSSSQAIDGPLPDSVDMVANPIDKNQIDQKLDLTDSTADDLSSLIFIKIFLKFHFLMI